MSTVRPLQNLRHLSPEELAAEVRGIQTAQGRGLPVRLSMPAALTLAHFWAVPGDGEGSVLAELAKGKEVDRDALLADVDAVLAHCARTRPPDLPEDQDADVQQLQLLRSWVETQR